VAFLWAGKDSLIGDDLQWHSPPTEGDDLTSSYFAVTISPGQHKTFMFVAVQGNQSVSYTTQLATELDANPLKLYYGKN
jgi:hypothetical protein